MKDNYFTFVYLIERVFILFYNNVRGSLRY